MLDGWACPRSGCECGAVPTSDTACVSCATSHALPPATRQAIEKRWRDEIDGGLTGLQRDDAGHVRAGMAEAALSTVDQILTQSAGKLCERHALRHKARRLRVYALNSSTDGARAKELVAAVEDALHQMEEVLSPLHPEVAFFRNWLAKALWKQANVAASASEGKVLHARACQEARTAADQLAISHGQDHPTVAQWRRIAATKRLKT